jgi:hypothetical protein
MAKNLSPDNDVARANLRPTRAAFNYRVMMEIAPSFAHLDSEKRLISLSS